MVSHDKLIIQKRLLGDNVRFVMYIYHVWILCGLCIFFIACAPESKYAGGSGAFKGYESLHAYKNGTIKYKNDYIRPSHQSSFSGTIAMQNTYTLSKKKKKKNKNNQTNRQTSNDYQSPVQGNGDFIPTESLLGGMRESEAIQRATMRPYTVKGITYRPHSVKVGDSFDGIASWYGPDFHAKATSNGETYNMYAHTAAHKTLPMNTIVKVYNKDNGKTTVVRINDRGPFVQGRIIDLSNIAARDIAMVSKGVANVRIEVIGFGGDTIKNTSAQSNSPSNNATSSNQNNNAKQYTSQSNNASKPTKSTTTHQSSQDSKTLQQDPNDTPVQYIRQDNVNNTNLAKQHDDNAIQQPRGSDNIAIHDTPTDSVMKQDEILRQDEDSQILDMPTQIIEEELPKEPQSHAKQAIPTQQNTIHSPDSNQIAHNETSQKAQEVNRLNNDKASQKTHDDQKIIDTQKIIDNRETDKNLDASLDASIEKLKESTHHLQSQSISIPDTSIHANKQPQQPQSQVAQEKSNATTNGKFMISLNVFSQRERAEQFMQQSLDIAKNTPYQVHIVQTDKGLHRVALRGFKTYDEAKKIMEKYAISGHIVQE